MERTRSAKETGHEEEYHHATESEQARKASRGPITIGMDLGDKTSRYCVLDDRGEVAGEGSVATTKKAMAENSAAWAGRASRWKWARTRRGSAGCWRRWVTK